jgi:Right handed beta helix region
LIVEDCAIQEFNGYGVYFGSTAGRGLLQVSNSQIFDSADGIYVSPQNGQIASVTLNRVELMANSNYGLYLGGNGIVAGTMRDSVAGENGNSGVVTQASQVFFTIEESSVVDNLVNGIQTNSASSSIKVGASTIGGNGTGVLASSGSIVSFGNNQISDNGSDGTFTSTKALKLTWVNAEAVSVGGLLH